MTLRLAVPVEPAPAGEVGEIAQPVLSEARNEKVRVAKSTLLRAYQSLLHVLIPVDEARVSLSRGDIIPWLDKVDAASATLREVLG